MAWITWLMLRVFFLTFASGLFTVQVDKSEYKSEFRGDVVMGCGFQTPSPTALSGIKVIWHWITPGGEVREVYRMDNAVERLTTQHPDYRGRVRLLTDEIQRGWAKLQVSNLKISDSGKYQCYVQTVAGADYGTLTLSVFAPFRSIDKSIEKVSEQEQVRLTCQSEGYPQPHVTWYNGQQAVVKPTTTIQTTADQLFKVTSQINVTSLEMNNYTCHFSDYSATIQIPDDIPVPTKRNTVLIVLLCLALSLVGIVLVFVGCKLMQKANQKDSINDEENTKINQSNINGLKSLLEDHYSKLIQNLPRAHRDTQGPHFTLYDIQGKRLNLPDLVPANGEALLLEGPTESGKTTLVHTLVSLWMEPAPDLPDLSRLQLVVCIDGSNTNSNLWDEITTQLSLKDVAAENDLRNVLTSETLLIVDGYKEGNALFDSSLQRFLFDRKGHRVLLTTSQEHTKVKEMVGTGATVTLQIQRQKYG
ncbi:programmed cell death 1 ligand 1-like [Eucyclogobius newberryi]|uniref:programmed cell death 1 ligand 1-like n=1 Tax=Eucyclogobius newberryi TaxID=166745 RepID=UPI003B5BD489